MHVIDLNCDAGESFGQFKLGSDEELFQYVSSANIACGYHAGDHNVIAKTVKLAKNHNVAIGAHPGFQDLIGFGRREMQLTVDEIYNLVIYQLGALKTIAEVHGEKLHHVKPHGALYNVAAKNRDVAFAIAKAVKAVDDNLILYGLAGSELCQVGQEIGLKVAHEVFADRTYQADGSLTPRTQKNSLIQDPHDAVKQILEIVKFGKVTAITGEEINIRADTICIHGDGEYAAKFAMTIRRELEKENIVIRKIGDS